MGRGPLYQEGYKPLFSGHETFPLRYGWLKKAFDAVMQERHNPDNKSVFLNDEAIGRFGVGKNMVGSMRHWATCAGVIGEEASTGQIVPTEIGSLLFGEPGLDPFLEDTPSLWLLHWFLCSGEPERPMKTTWFWVFNHFTGSDFRREDVIDGLMKLAESRSWQRVSPVTVKRDVECFVRTYEAAPVGNRGAVEESLESPLAELGLLRGFKGYYHIARGPKPSLPPGVFALALNNFWARQGSTKTLSFEMLAYEPGSPGRVFVLDDSSLADKLLALEDVTKGAFRWSETAGLKQVLRERPLHDRDVFRLLEKDFRTGHKRGVAG